MKTFFFSDGFRLRDIANKSDKVTLTCQTTMTPVIFSGHQKLSPGRFVIMRLSISPAKAPTATV